MACHQSILWVSVYWCPNWSGRTTDMLLSIKYIISQIYWCCNNLSQWLTVIFLYHQYVYDKDHVIILAYWKDLCDMSCISGADPDFFQRILKLGMYKTVWNYDMHDKIPTLSPSPPSFPSSSLSPLPLPFFFDTGGMCPQVPRPLYPRLFSSYLHYGDRAFYACAPKRWNSHPSNLKSTFLQFTWCFQKRRKKPICLKLLMVMFFILGTQNRWWSNIFTPCVDFSCTSSCYSSSHRPIFGLILKKNYLTFICKRIK